jgi:hypothetical protein
MKKRSGWKVKREIFCLFVCAFVGRDEKSKLKGLRGFIELRYLFLGGELQMIKSFLCLF